MPRVPRSSSSASSAAPPRPSAPLARPTREGVAPADSPHETLAHARPFSFTVLNGDADGGIALTGVVWATDPDHAAQQIARHPTLAQPHAPTRSVLLQALALEPLTQHLATGHPGVAATTGPWRVRALPAPGDWWPD